MLAPFNAKAVDEKEEKLFGYYNKAASCAVAYNYQQRYAKIANLIDNGTNSANLLVNLQPSVSAWITISITLEQMLIKHYSWTKDSITAYRRDQFDRINFISGRDFFHKPPEEYLGILFNVTSECPKLAVEIQEFVMGFGTNITPDPAPDTTDDKPKRKM
jgi:hypothetical protein